MSLRDLLESGANVSVTVTLDDLRAIFNEAAKGGRIFGALKSYPFGGRKRYMHKDVEAIRTGRKGGSHAR